MIFLTVCGAYGAILIYGMRMVLPCIEDVPPGVTLRHDAAELAALLLAGATIVTAFLRRLRIRVPKMPRLTRPVRRPRRVAPPARPAGKHRKAPVTVLVLTAEPEEIAA